MNPRAVAAALCLAHFLLWGVGSAVAFDVPRLDGAEQLAWSYAMEGGYWKHPPLPTWIMHGLVALFGPSAALTYLAAQASVAIALFFAFLLGCEWMDARRSLIAMALTSLAIFYNAGAEAFNHDLALLPLIAGAAWAAVRAMRTQSLALWCVAGAFGGLALLTKYIAVLSFAALGVALLLDARSRTARNAVGMAAGVVAALAVFSPHVAWLVKHDWQPLHYAQALSQALAGNRFVGIALFLVAIGVRVLPPVVIGALAYRQIPREAPTHAADARRFLWVLAAGPLALTLAYGLVTGTTLPQRWAEFSLLFAAWLLVDLLRLGRGDAPLRRLAAFAAAGHAVIFTAVTVIGPQVALARHMPTRPNFPAAAMADAARKTWAQHSTHPLRLVVANSWLGGNLIAQWHEPLPVLVEADPNRAPWVPRDAPQRCGALVLLDLGPHADRDPVVEKDLRAFTGQAVQRGEWALPWPNGPAAGDSGPRSRIEWAILAPPPGAHCPL